MALWEQQTRQFYEKVPVIRYGDLFGLRAIRNTTKGFNEKTERIRFYNVWVENNSVRSRVPSLRRRPPRSDDGLPRPTAPDPHPGAGRGRHRRLPADPPDSRRPGQRHARPDATPAQIDATRQALGLDRPLHEQLFKFYARVLRGDLGSRTSSTARW